MSIFSGVIGDPKKALFERTQERSFRKAEIANTVNYYMELGSWGWGGGHEINFLFLKMS